MRPGTSRRLRLGILSLALAVVALAVGAALVSAVETPSYECFKIWDGTVKQDSGPGEVDTTVTIDGKPVSITFTWTHDKHWTVSISGGGFQILKVKCGNQWVIFGPYAYPGGTGPFSGFVPNPSPHSDDGLAMSHIEFCAWAEEETTGSLTITKVITGDQPPDSVWAQDDFEIVVTGPAPSTAVVWSGNFPPSGPITINGLSPGTYTVSETSPGYPWTASGEGDVVVAVGAAGSKTITNTGSTSTSSTTTEPPVGALLITKAIEGDQPPDSTWTEEDFNVTVIGPLPDQTVVYNGPFDSNGEILLTGLAPGTYSVSENTPGYPWTASGEGDVEVVGGAPAPNQIAITNTGSTSTTTSTSTSTTEGPRGALLITKAIEGDQPPDSTWTEEDFNVTVIGPLPDQTVVYNGPFDSNGEILLTGLVPGTYSVSENTPGYPWTASGEGDVEVLGGQEVPNTLEITNTGSTSTTTTVAQLGSLLVTKDIDGDNPGGLGYGDFTIVVTGPAPASTVVWNGPFDGSGQILITGLLPGTYTVTETSPGYPWSVSGEGPVNVVAGQEPAEVLIENTGSTTTVSRVTTSYTTTTKGTSTTENTTTTKGTSTTENTSTTVKGSTTSVTVKGWIAEVDDVQTGGGGTAAASNALWFVAGFGGILALGLGAAEIGARRRKTAA